VSAPFSGQPAFPVGLWERLGLIEPCKFEGPFIGFSSALTWKVDCGGQSLAIKRLRWPGREIARRKATHAVLRILHEAHQLPVSLPRGLVSVDGWEWECHSWLPGSVLPEWSHAQRQRAAQWLGRFHRVLASPALPVRPGRLAELNQSSGVQARLLGLLQPIDFRQAQGLRGPLGQFFSRVNPRAWMALGEDCFGRLRSWKRPVWLQAIHGDPHPGNWLWEKEELGGVIDFLDASQEGDPRELDLARLLGSVVWSSHAELAEAIESYELAGSAASGGLALDAELVRLLECSGVWMRISNWAGMLGRAEVSSSKTSLSPELSARLERLVQDASAWLGVFLESTR